MRRKLYIFCKEDKTLYRIVSSILKKYTYEVFKRGLSVGFNWNSNVDKVNYLSTMHKQEKNKIE